jgi:transposase-like protein
MPALRKYPDELRERAIRLTLDASSDTASRAGACTRIGDQLGINVWTLRGWVMHAEVDAGARPGTTTSDSAKLAELERENRELRRANAISRTASAFFAAELERLPTIIDYIERYKNVFGVEPICTTLTSGCADRSEYLLRRPDPAAVGAGGAR